MKKLLRLSALILALVLAITSLAACGAPLEPGQGKNTGTKSKIYIIGDGTKVEPLSVLISAKSYEENVKQWLFADGEGMFGASASYLQENEDKIPAVSHKNIEFDISSNGTLGKVEIFGKAYDLEKTILNLSETDIFADVKEAFSSLAEGTHYVALYVEWKGDLIETDKGNEYESSGHIYYFKITL